MKFKRNIIISGHFGSGKTQIAINLAKKLREENKKVAIVDFDIVNPFFRTADSKKMLEDIGVKVVLPMYAKSNVDVPAMPPEIKGLFEHEYDHVIFDTGGDDLGAKAISRYINDFNKETTEHLCVVNLNRPMTDSFDKIENMLDEIEKSARLEITGLVNNSVLIENFDNEDFERSVDLIKKVAKNRNIKLKFNIIGENDKYHGEIDNIFYVRLYTLFPWG